MYQKNKYGYETASGHQAANVKQNSSASNLYPICMQICLQKLSVLRAKL